MTGKGMIVDDLGFTEQEKKMVYRLRDLLSKAKERGVFHCSSNFRNCMTTLYLETPSEPPLDCFKGEKGWYSLHEVLSFDWNAEGFQKAINFLKKKLDN